MANDRDITPARLDEIEARWKKATEGPWHVDEIVDEWGDTEGTVEVLSRGIRSKSAGGLNTGDESELFSPEDADFIAYAHDDVPDLVARVRELERERDEARDKWRSDYDRLTAQVLELGRERDIALAEVGRLSEWIRSVCQEANDGDLDPFGAMMSEVLGDDDGE